ncbi:hypothetical protein [Natrarchaeobius chitinivorans]|uniref:Uncharacterized protein n=1 Tax=Natrarchaeobius chitinivorans TaxID=1679083 RepID=A0A3N6MA02_NATCH|nr:hypothetical protein [Natrarchaeobius chitinivorans]RQG90396.1 hypothetical protein EA473_21240 [Natrarchaeobius chitinivorans]
MPCPKCDDVPFLGDYSRDFVLTRYHVDVGQPSEFRVESKLETVLWIDGDLYRVESLVEEDPDNVRSSIDGLLQDERFEKISDNLPDNLPQAYDEDSYLSRHLPETLRQKLTEVAADHSLTPKSVLLLGFVESKNKILGKADNTLVQYIETRDSLANHLDNEGGVTPRIQREFVAHLLLATALTEELTSEALFNEIYREEHRLWENKRRINYLSQDQRLKILKDNGVISKDLDSKVRDIKDLRDSLVHDPRRRTAMEETHESEWVNERLVEIDEAVAGILDITGKTAARLIAENGPTEYVGKKCEDALREARQHWEDEHQHRFSLLEGSDIVEIADLRWKINLGSLGNRDVSQGVSFEQLPDNEEDATTEEIRLFETIMEFLRSCEDFLVRRIERDLEQANLDRQDFTVLCLLCAEQNTYEDVAELLGSTVGYVQRKENVLAWRSSEFEKDELGDLPKPNDPIPPLSQSEDTDQ